MFAAEHGHVECAQMLIAAGADLNRQNSKGWSAAMFAAYEGKEHVLDALIAGKADLNLRARNEVSALGYPYMKRRTTCAEKLKAAGAIK